MNMLTGEIKEEMEEVSIYPAKHFITEEEKLQAALGSIQEELEEKNAELLNQVFDAVLKRLFADAKLKEFLES